MNSPLCTKLCVKKKSRKISELSSVYEEHSSVRERKENFLREFFETNEWKFSKNCAL